MLCVPSKSDFPEPSCPLIALPPFPRELSLSMYIPRPLKSVTSTFLQTYYKEQLKNKRSNLAVLQQVRLAFLEPKVQMRK